MAILEHRKPVRTEARQVLVTIALTLGSLGALMAGLLVYGLESWSVGILWFVVLLFIGLCGLAYAGLNFFAQGEFICRLDGKTLECLSPVPACGESFKLPVAEIVSIEKELWGDSHGWYLRDASGRRYWLTANYDNPAEEFLVRLRELRPSIQQLGV